MFLNASKATISGEAETKFLGILWRTVSEEFSKSLDSVVSTRTSSDDSLHLETFSLNSAFSVLTLFKLKQSNYDHVNLFKWANHGLILWFLKKIEPKNLRLQQDSNSNCLGRRKYDDHLTTPTASVTFVLFFPSKMA